MTYNYKEGILVPFVQKFYKQMIVAVAAIFIASLAVMTLSAKAADQTVWDQGFESDTAGWFDSVSSWRGTATQVSSGDDGITSSAGSGHAVFEGDTSSAPFSTFDEYRDEWTPWTAEIDVYLDPSWVTGTGFDYSVAANGSDGNHQRDYIFHVTKDTSTGNLLVAGSNNTNFAPREDLENLNNYEVTSAGWYTLQHVFRDDAGSLAVDLNLLDSSSSVVFTETRTNVADTIPGEVGGNRYSWFTFINVENGIAVDEHQLVLNLPDPVLEYSVNGGGHILEGEGKKRKNFNDISFGLDVKSYNTGVEGSATVRFHNVAGDKLDKTTFHANEFTEFIYFDGNANCDAAVRLTAVGSWDGVDGVTLILRVGDNNDTVRVQLNGPGVNYDSNAGDFPGESNCVGTARTSLDKGNISITKYED